jgi:UDP-2,3-diacylglucosamine pyrophosphatase LpxH
LQYKNIVYLVDGIHVEHGHMHEPINRMDPRKLFIKQDLLEPILNLPLGSHFFIEFVLKLKEKYPHVDKIRPIDMLFKWALINDPKLLFVGIKLLIKYLYKLLFVHDRNHSWSARRIMKMAFSSAIFPDLSQSAKKILSDDRVHSVVFGHTHIYEYKKWGSKKEYFNTGTWTELTSLDVTSFGKITKLTYVMFDYAEGDQEPHGRLKEWKGFHRIEEDVAVA